MSYYLLSLQLYAITFLVAAYRLLSEGPFNALIPFLCVDGSTQRLQ